MGLGSADLFTLAEARDKALAARRIVAEGIDPIETRRAAHMAARADAAKAMTFKQCAEAYIRSHQAGWRNAKHGAQWTASLQNYVYPVFGDLPVQAIDVALVMKAIEPIWAVKPETAGRVRGRIEAALGWATTRGYRPPGENPARWRGHLENLLPARSKVRRVTHYAALPYTDLATFMAALRRQDGIPARALEFCILTAARTNEVIGARWDEIDLAQRLWTVPPERMKQGREHRVPLSDPALVVVNAMAGIRQGDFIFPGGRAGAKLSNMSMLMLLRRMGRDDVTAHGFRSTFRDWAAESTSYPAEVAEMALAHRVGTAVEQAYRRSDLFDRRRRLMDEWAKFCAAPAKAGEVVPIRAAEVVR
jgi:integrase